MENITTILDAIPTWSEATLCANRGLGCLPSSIQQVQDLAIPAMCTVWVRLLHFVCVLFDAHRHRLSVCPRHVFSLVVRLPVEMEGHGLVWRGVADLFCDSTLNPD